ncbi:NADP-dependent malic enzyme [Taibaiella sp. KBW10]|uniref:NADP-dependent malic enzyme n=1 Tax=Taibaiella sp. KBW10 TaxID=2153357 RepID=UPI000F5A9202|nr:NADP-dependent malic enzyme [Taibaiella sp. KBW10]RQO31557.1 NADP-dependent malic enzyme [Taibaiella sp. KBW10]
MSTHRNIKQEALDYHSNGRPGKIKVVPTKNTKTQRDLSLAYSPGVAEPCLKIKENPEDIYKYTAKGNLVAVISNGTAVLGLGDIGPGASKPVMEGKGVLFKIFADIDVFDLEVDTKNIDEFVTVVKALEPTFGGINLEDIKAPECFEIERRLKEAMNIPVMHDDQHGTAMISGAALLNALEIVDKEPGKIKMVVSGAGAAAVACVKMYLNLGVKKENILMFDIDGIINIHRTNLDESRMVFARDTPISTLAEALSGADVFIGLSAGNILSQDMIRAMAPNPIVFAMANPNPEITYDDAVAARPDIIMATGRSDYPNQVNNVLGFPFIFRGALDVRATAINEEMKIAAVYALASLTKQPVPEIVNIAYGEKNITFGPQYIIPKPLDPRLLATVAPAVAQAAMNSGVARKPIMDMEAYKQELNDRLGINNSIVRVINEKARKNPQRIVFAEADNIKVLKAAQIVEEEGFAFPILLGNEKKIKQLIAENKIEIKNPVIIDPRSEEALQKRVEYGEMFFEKRKRRGLNLYEAKKIMRERNYFGCMMVANGEADGLISGLTRNYPDTIRPALQTIGVEQGVKKVAGMYIILTPKGPLFLADTTVNLNPNAEELADIALLTAKEVERFNITPRVAMLSYSNFGSSDTPEARMMGEAARIAKAKQPDLIIDGEIQAALAFDTEVLKENYPFSDLVSGGVNTLIFPNLSSGNIAYNLLKEVAEFELIGPVLLGLEKPVHILQLGSSVQQIVNMVVMTAFDAQKAKGQ